MRPPGRPRGPGPGRRALAALGLLLLAAGAAAADEGGPVRIATDRLELVWPLTGADPVQWRACHPSCVAADRGAGVSVRFTGDADRPQPRLTLVGPTPAVALERLRFTAQIAETPRARVATFQAELPGSGASLVKAFAVSRDGYDVEVTVRLLGPGAAAFMADRRLELTLAAGQGLRPPPAAGIAAFLERITRVSVTGAGVGDVTAGDEQRLPAGDWAGLRGRFWAFLASPGTAMRLAPQPGPGLRLAPEADGLAWRARIYSGPVERAALASADPRLEGLLFSGLWWWLRALSLGLLWLLDGLTVLIGTPGPAIMALAVCVKTLIWPLTALAGRLQAQVDQTRARLQPEIDAIRAAYRGEERTRRLVALYRSQGAHPLYALKSLPGVLIQLPVFIAAFDMLAEDFALLGAPFLWIRDLSRPDAWMPLPVALPGLGGDLNLLPVLMTAVSVAAALRFASPALPPPLARRQRRHLLAMAVVFFGLFYACPAALVLYWTSTNALQLVAAELARWRRAP